MNALVLTQALVWMAASPAEALYQRDLFGAVLALSRPGAMALPHSALAADLVRLIQCEPLPPLAEDAPDRLPRLLVRAEAARGARLGDAARTSATVWSRLLEPSYFRRTGPDVRGALVWPETQERWPGERIRFQLTPPCASPRASEDSEVAVLSLELIDAVRVNPQLAPRATALSLQRTLLMLRAGEREEATETARRIDPETAEPHLVALAKLVRLELGIDPPEGWPDLAAHPPAGLRRHATVRAAEVLLSQGRFIELLAITEAFAPENELSSDGLDGSLARDLACRRASALVAMGQLDPAARFVLPRLEATSERSDGASLCLRELAMELASRRGLDATTEALLAAIGPAEKVSQRWAEAADRALTRGRLELAQALGGRAAAAPPRRWQLMAEGLLAELAWLRGDLPGLGTRLDALFHRPRREGARARREREKAALSTAHALVGRMALAPSTPALRARLLEALRELETRGLRRNKEAVAALRLAAEEGARAVQRGAVAIPVVAVGGIDVRFTPPALPPPSLPLAFDEPFSLLAIPDPEGRFHAGFREPQPDEVSDAT